MENQTKDALIECSRCHGDACYYSEQPEFKSYTCFSCGFTTNSYWSESNDKFSELEKTTPELYQALKFTDESGNYWYPTTINHRTKGMVFVDGTSIDDWKWSAVKAVPIGKKEKHKFPPNQTHKTDMTTIKYFDEKDYMEALDYIGYFEAPRV